MRTSRLSFCIIIQFFLLAHATPQQLTLKPTLHSIGYRVELPPGYDADSSAFTQVRYRATGGDWQPGFPAARLAMGEFMGSLFQLDPATTYELEVSVVDSFPVFKKDILTATASTLAVPNLQQTGNLKWVSPAGSGNAYTETAPGNLQTLFSSGLDCGTTVLLKGGTYLLGNLTLNLTQDCPETAPITIMAAPGATPVFDGGSYDTYAWTQAAGDTNIWWTNLPPDLDFNALCLVDGERMYPYAFLTPPPLDPTYPSLWTLGYDLPGFYRNVQNQVFIKTLDHRNINDSQVVFGKKSSCFLVNGNNKTVRLGFKGIHFRHYGKGSCNKDFFGNPTECYPSFAMRFTNASKVIVDSCVFDFCNYAMAFDGNCNDNIVMNCRITDGTGYWSHAAFKRTIDVITPLLDPSFGTYGRYLECSGIHFRPAKGQEVQGNIVWKNTVHGVVNGIGLGFFNGSVMRESDISENQVSWCYDGIDAIGEHRNARIWGNVVGHCPVGASLIGQEQKPAYIFRNVFHHLDQRQNYQTDPNFLACDNTETHQSWSTALKLNAGSEGQAGDQIYFIHNTVHSTEPLGFNLYLWLPTWKVLQLKNNLFYAEGNANFFFDGVANQPAYHFESIGDNIINPNSGVLGIVRPVHGMLNNCFEYEEAVDLDNGLSDATGSPFCILQNTLHEPPYFLDPENNDFRLQSVSPLIDQGLAIPGFNNHFNGAAPEVGAFELPDSVVSVKPGIWEEQGLVIFPNPANGDFFVRFVTASGDLDMEVFDVQGRFIDEKHFPDLPPGRQMVSVEVPSVQPGVYLLKFLLDGKITVRRLVVK